MENNEYHNEEIGVHAQESPGPCMAPRNQGEFSEKRGFKGMSYLLLSFLLLLAWFSCVSVF